MKKYILILALGNLLISCLFYHRGDFSNGVCRPKHPNFKLLKKPFIETKSIIFNNLYVENDYRDGIGFYSDGRMFLVNNYNYKTQLYDSLNSIYVQGKHWNNAINRGYWRSTENKLEIEWFACGDNGFYKREKGEIKGDSIILYDIIFTPFEGKIIRKRYFLLSEMKFR